MEAELREVNRPARLSALNLAEVIDVLTRIYGRAPASTMNALVLLEAAGLRVVPVDAEIGVDAGELHARHYDRKTSPLSMADCVALATARSVNEPLATADPPLAAAARAIGVAILPLPDASGRRPAP